MVRAAAKNHPSVAIVTSPAQYADAARRRRSGGFTLAQRQRYAAEAFVHTASYDVAVASWMGSVLTDTSEGPGSRPGSAATWDAAPQCCATARTRTSRPRCTGTVAAGLANAEQLHGKEMSYNNYVDADAARRAAYDFDRAAVAVIKHANPCGIAVGADVAEAHRKAHACDPVSAFGGVIATNVPVSVAMAEQVAEVFTEVVVAPASRTARWRCWPRRRTSGCCAARRRPAAVRVRGRSPAVCCSSTSTTSTRQATTRRPGRWPPVQRGRRQPLADLAFAWTACRAVKSNAILLAADGASVGVGMGQVNRVDSCRLAVERAGRAGDRARSPPRMRSSPSRTVPRS